MTSPALAPPQNTAEFWIKRLQLVPHPEGGYYSEVVRSAHKVDNEEGNRRHAYTTIYFLCTPESPSHLHRLCSDETWMYHAGDPLQLHVILKDPQDEDRIAAQPPAAPQAETDTADARPKYQVYRRVLVGARVERGELLQYTVPGGAIFGSSVAADGADGQAGYSLVSCIVSPGFDYRDFEIFTQAQLMELYPQHEAVIKQMAYETLPNHARLQTTEI
ncbi:putative zinc finger protein family member [Leishmania major strain Friedlin]|uniref:Putative zinc finger protein family member n=1 Tax=Leishmania major TaxID=5664 RepID=E9AES8_LEIMA|nr:putative zinc finger protein family member [Leishmania major strain Friedlin]CAG9582454.1 zinc_finger_protein_family_member_-_putative [Leishmania major strain Friedlin]CBZ12731.1 putative zinc finger protein family member [Leishmania major strain Friedlin]|eukprot:XP_003722498.1 putative zinc finger protein family member [Leishmania major strain Friedlin]